MATHCAWCDPVTGAECFGERRSSGICAACLRRHFAGLVDPRDIESQETMHEDDRPPDAWLGVSAPVRSESDFNSEKADES